MKNTKVTKETIKYLCYLAVCAVNKKTADPNDIKDVDWKALLKLAGFHSIESLIFYAVEPIKHELNIDEKLLAQWENRKKYNIIKNIQMDIGRRELFDAMEKEGCWYMPLKGVVLKDMYPAAGMRQMSDNDILFDINYRTWVRDWFENHGYTVELFDRGHDDVYIKGIYRCYEMHVSLVGSDNKIWAPYYENVKERLVPREGTGCGYEFTDEDFYLYMMLHSYKHYSSAGTGLKILFDCYVFLKKKKDKMDWHYIKLESEKLGIAEYEKSVRELSEKLSQVELDNWDTLFTKSQKDLLKFIVKSGTYGTVKVRAELGAKKFSKEGITLSGKVKFLCSRIFVPASVMKIRHPICRKVPLLIPFFYIMRIIKGIFQKRVYKEAKKTIKASK